MFRLIRIWVRKLQHFAFSRGLNRQHFIFSSCIGYVRYVRIIALPSPVNIFKIELYIFTLRFLPLLEMTSMRLLSVIFHEAKQPLATYMTHAYLIPATVHQRLMKII